MNTQILIATNGSEETWPAIEYGAWLASTLNLRVVLLGIVEHAGTAPLDQGSPVEEFLARAVDALRTRRVDSEIEVQRGNAEQIVPSRVNDRDFITVLGPLGRPRLRRWLTGRSISHLMAEIESPIVYVPQARIPLRRLLIALGGLGYELTAEHLAIQVARQARAEVALLHVVPPVDLDYPTARIMRKEWQHLDDTNTPVGRYLRQASEIAANAGLHARVIGRQGIVVEEILAEAREGDYDLLCMGSPYSSTALRKQYSPNITADIAESVRSPTLSARYKGQ